MGKALIIAEKPSVAGDIARVLGGFKKEKDFFESEDYVVTSAVGHLLQITEPEEFVVKRGKWTFTNLPVIPDHFDLKPIEKTESRLKLVVKLIKRKDIDVIVNACDAGREGELIFRYILKHSNSTKPTKRLWLQSMTPAAIRDGFTALRDGEKLQPLADAAVCRSESDWLVGINGTRAMTAFNSKSGGFYLTTVGRVQTPTLAIIVERENAIRKFKSRDYFELHGTFGCQAGEYVGRWFDEDFKRSKEKGADAELRPERIWEKSLADQIKAKCLGKPGIVTEESKPSTSVSPLLYDLTSLQREANGRFGFSASSTLKIAQSLYERHKVLTYPRTDARALPEDYPDTVKKTMDVLKGASEYRPFATAVLSNGWVRPNKRIFNNAKISDHFAIIPTNQLPKKLNENEQRIYDLVVKRFLAIFHPPAEFKITTRITRVEDEAFKTDGKVLVNPGWLAVYGKGGSTDEDASLVAVLPDEKVDTKDIELKELETKPPARYSEATLLGAMEGAGKLVEDEELREAMSEKGLGTPATRASIIEGLVYEKYIYRTGRELNASAKGVSLIRLLHGLSIEELCSPELTGNWEYKLKQIEQNQMSAEEFMREIGEMTRRMVAAAKAYDGDTVPGDFGQLKTPCPKCSGLIKETYKSFKCSKCEFSLWKIVAGREFEIPEVEELITKRVIGPLDGFRSKMGRPFSAMIKMNDELKAEFDFGNDDKDGSSEAVDFTGKEPLGHCPKCQATVFENGMNYICEKAVGPDKSCDFRSGLTILQQRIEPEQMKKLLTEKKTNLLTKFISKRNGRAFKAHLVLAADGKVRFEFEKRDPSKKRGSKSTEPEEKVDFTGQEALGVCPKCEGKVFQSKTDYLCENLQRETKPCKFKVGKTILEQPVDEVQVKKLLTDRKSDLLTKFVSRYGKSFSAHLKMTDKGKVEFEFPDAEEE